MFDRTILYWYVKTKYITNQQKVICPCLLFIEMAGQQNTSIILCVKIPKLENCSLFCPCPAYKACQLPRGVEIFMDRDTYNIIAMVLGVSCGSNGHIIHVTECEKIPAGTVI